MRNKKAFFTHFSTRERLCESIGLHVYRHVVVNLVLFFAHACIQWWTRCTVYASTKDQSNGTQRINIQG